MTITNVSCNLRTVHKQLSSCPAESLGDGANRILGRLPPLSAIQTLNKWNFDQS